MTHDQIEAGGEYTAKVSGKVVTLRVEYVSNVTLLPVYHVLNLATNRRFKVESPRRFIAMVGNQTERQKQSDAVAKLVRSYHLEVYPKSPGPAETGQSKCPRCLIAGETGTVHEYPELRRCLRCNVTFLKHPDDTASYDA